MSIEEFLELLSDLITTLEEEAGCVGATADHIKALLADSIKAERNPHFIPIMRLGVELETCARAYNDNEAFREITDELFTPEEEEAIYAGDEE